MIAYIEGKLEVKNPAYVVIGANGVGYHINISLYTYDKIINAEKCRLWTHLVVREDAQLLYGFFDMREREVFLRLISISGVGPNLSRMVLSSLSPQELKRAIINNDVSLIKSVKGIGAKTAQRIVIELQDSITDISGEISDTQTDLASTSVRDEAVSALVMLGFPKQQAEKTIYKITGNSTDETYTAEALIKKALKSM